MPDPLETAELLSFTASVEARSLSRAAAQLGIPRATLGRRLSRLESRLGVRLLRRTTRSLVMTSAGETFYRHARIVLDAVAQAEDSMRLGSAVIAGSLRISVPPINDATFHALLCDFAERHPDVQLHVDFTYRYVDLRRDGYDLAIRGGSVLEPGLVARTLTRVPMFAVASPGYLAKHGTPRSALDLRKHRCLLGFARGELPRGHWPLLGGGQVHVEGKLASSNPILLCEAAVRGLGIAVLPDNFVARPLREGRLVHILRKVIGIESRMFVVYPEREFVPPQVRAFIDALAQWAPEGLSREVRATEPGEPGRLSAAAREPRTKRKRSG